LKKTYTLGVSSARSDRSAAWQLTTQKIHAIMLISLRPIAEMSANRKRGRSVQQAANVQSALPEVRAQAAEFAGITANAADGRRKPPMHLAPCLRSRLQPDSR